MVTLPKDAVLELGPIAFPLPSAVTFGYAKDPTTTTINFGFEFDMFTVKFVTDSASGMKMAQLTVVEGVTLRKLFNGVMGIFKSTGAGAADEPLAGASDGGGVGAFFDKMLDVELPEIEAGFCTRTFATTSTAV